MDREKKGGSFQNWQAQTCNLVSKHTFNILLVYWTNMFFFASMLKNKLISIKKKRVESDGET